MKSIPFDMGPLCPPMTTAFAQLILPIFFQISAQASLERPPEHLN